MSYGSILVPVTLSGFGPADVPSGVDVSATEAREDDAGRRSSWSVPAATTTR